MRYNTPEEYDMWKEYRHYSNKRLFVHILVRLKRLEEKILSDTGDTSEESTTEQS